MLQSHVCPRKAFTLLLLAVLPLFAATAAEAQPAFSKTFSPNTIGPGSVTTLTLTIDNSGSGVVATDLAFVDNLPAALTLANSGLATTDCGLGAVLTAPAGGSSITLTDGAVGALSICTVQVDVTASAIGTHVNTTGDLTSSAGNSGTATANLTVATDRPGFSKSFSPSTIPPGGRSTLTFTIDNSANTNQHSTLAFSDALPTGLVVADPANVTNTCVAAPFTGGVVNASPGSGTISLASGGGLAVGSVAAGSTCTISVDVTAVAVGTFLNRSGELLGAQFGSLVSSGIATDSITVPNAALLLTKAFTDDPVGQGNTVTLEFTINNVNRLDSATNIAFTDDLDATLTGLVATGLPMSNVCGAGSTLSGTGLLSLTGGNLPAEGSCTFSVTLQVPAAAATGAYPNTTSSITGDVGGSPVTSAAAFDTLFVEPVPVLTKQFIGDPVGPGGMVTLEFTITNPSTISAATDVAFTDPFPEIPIPGPLPANPCGAGSFLFTSPINGTETLQLLGGNIPANDSCTFSMPVNIPDGFPAGTYINTTDEIAATIEGSTRIGSPTSDDLIVVGAPRLTKEFTDDPATAGGTATLEFTLTHDATAANNANNVMFTDDLAAMGITGLVATGLPINDACGPGNGTLAGSMGDTQLTFSGGTLTPGQVCTFSVTLSIPAAASAGNFNNSTSGISADVGGVATVGSAGTDTLSISGLMFTKEFLNDPVLPGDTVTLRFTIENNHPTDDATGIVFTDNLGTTLSGLTAATLPMDPCGAGSAIVGPSFLVFTGGSLTAGSSCQFDLQLTVPGGAADGNYSNVTSNITATMGGSMVVGDPASDTLDIFTDLLGLTKEFIDDPVAPGGTATLRFTIDNLDAVNAITGITFTDDLDAALTGLAAIGLPAPACGGTVAGTGLLTLTGATVAAGGNCSFDVTVQVPAGVSPGTVITNTTSGVTGSIGGVTVNGGPATDNLLINFVTLTKSFNGPAFPGGSPVLTFTLTNQSATAANGLSFSDDLSATLPGLIATGLPINDACGAGSLVAGTTLITVSGAALAPMGSCSIMVSLSVPGTATAGTYPNTTTNVFQSGLTVGSPATDDLIIEPSPVFAKAFAPNIIGLGQGSTLTFTIDNSGSTQIVTGLTFIDNLPAGISVALAPSVANTCGGTVGAVAASGTISLAGGTVAAGATCTLSVDVTGSAVGALINTSGDLTSTGGNSGTAVATLTVVPQPGFAKVFSPDPINVGGVSTLTFTIDNSGSTAAAGGLDFTDNLPAQIVVATPGNASTTCGGGTLTATDGSGAISYTGGSVAAGATCIVRVDVTSSVAGTHTNLSGALTSIFGNSGTATDTLTVNPPPGFSKAFNPDPILLNGVSTLTFTIDNSAATVSANGLDFTDNLPAGTAVATPDNASTTCAGGTLTAADGSSVITYTGGGSVAAGATCTVQVDIQGTAAGTFTNTSGDLTSTLGNSGTATDTLTVNPPPGFTKVFGTNPSIVGGISTLTFTIDNTAGTIAATALDFTDNLPAGLEVAATPNASTDCTGGTLTAASGATAISYSGGTVAATATCTVQVDVTSTTAGDFVNLTGDLTSSLGNSGTATDTLRVNPVPVFTKVFAPGVIAIGGTSTLTFTIDNSGSTVAATGLDFTNAFPDIFVQTPANASTTCAGGMLNTTTSLLTYTAGSVAAGATCTVQVDVTQTVPGTFVNVSGDLTSSLGNSGTATDTLDVTAVLLGFSKAFAPATIVVGETSTLTLTIDNTNAAAVGNVAFVDNLPAGMTVRNPANAMTTCTGGTITAAAGSGSVSYAGGTVPASASCSVSVDVSSSTVGLSTNTTGDLTSDVGNSGTATADLVVKGEPTLTKAFSQPVLPGGTVDLEYTITNPSASESLDALTFTDDLDAVITGLVITGLVATGLPANDVCGAGSQISGSGLLTLTAGTLAPSASCTFTVSLTVPGTAAVGIYPSTSGPLSGTIAGGPFTAGTAAADLEVIFLEFVKIFDAEPVVAGETTFLEFTITNPDPVNTATDLTFTDDLDAMLPGTVAVGLPLADVCGPGSSVDGTSIITLMAGTLGPLESCVFQVEILVPTDAPGGEVVNTTSPLSGSVGGAAVSGDPADVATAVLEVLANILAIPTMDTVGLWLLAALLGLLAVGKIRRQ